MEWLWGLALDVWISVGATAASIANDDWSGMTDAWHYAGLNPNLDVLKWLLAAPPPLRTPKMVAAGFQGAALKGSMDAAQLMCQHVSAADILAVTSSSARSGNVRSLATLRALQPPVVLPPSLLVKAARAGKREAIEYLHSPAGGGPHPWTVEISTAAASYHHHALVWWLVKDQKCPFNCVERAVRRRWVCI